MITLDQAGNNIQRKVVYGKDNPYVKTEEGVITSVNSKYVFVRYGDDCNSKATSADDLDFL